MQSRDDGSTAARLALGLPPGVPRAETRCLGPQLRSPTSSPSCGQRGLRTLSFVLQGLFLEVP